LTEDQRPWEEEKKRGGQTTSLWENLKGKRKKPNGEEHLSNILLGDVRKRKSGPDKKTGADVSS